MVPAEVGVLVPVAAPVVAVAAVAVALPRGVPGVWAVEAVRAERAERSRPLRVAGGVQGAPEVAAGRPPQVARAARAAPEVAADPRLVPAAGVGREVRADAARRQGAEEREEHPAGRVVPAAWAGPRHQVARAAWADRRHQVAPEAWPGHRHRADQVDRAAALRPLRAARPGPTARRPAACRSRPTSRRCPRAAGRG